VHPILGQVINSFRNLQEKFSSINQDEMAKRYPAVRRDQRYAAAVAFRESTLPELDTFRRTVLPAELGKLTAAREKARASIRRGLGPNVKLKEPRTLPAYASDETLAVFGVLRALSDKLETVATQAGISNAITLNSMQPTDALAGRLAQYVETARKGEVLPPRDGPIRRRF
jgi:hypothetical protein